MSTDLRSHIRHPQLSRHCRDLSAVRLGRKISQWADSGAPELVLLNKFGWAQLGEISGKKSLPAKGQQLPAGQERLLMPVPLLVQSQITMDETISFRAEGPGGFRVEGTLDPATKQPSIHGGLVIDPAVRIRNTLTSRDQVLSTADDAWWRLVTSTEAWMRTALDEAHEKIRAEIYWSLKIWEDQWVDTQHLDAIASEDVHAAEAPLMRKLVSQVEDSEVFTRVDPLKDLLDEIRVLARRRIFQTIGDPIKDGSGPKIRAASRLLGTRDAAHIAHHLVATGELSTAVTASTIQRALNPVPSVASLFSENTDQEIPGVRR